MTREGSRASGGERAVIISHTHGFVFLATRDTDSERIEVALSCHCGPKDVLTPLEGPNELLRRDLGVVPRNYARWPFGLLAGGLVNVHSLNRKPWRGLNRKGMRRFEPYPSAHTVRDTLGEEAVQGYFTFAVERDPMDRLAARYYDEARRGAVRNVEDFFAKGLPPANSNLYGRDGVLDVHALLRFDQLQEDFTHVLQRLGLAERPWLPKSTRPRRANHRGWRQLFSPLHLDEAIEHYSQDYRHMFAVGMPIPPEVVQRLPDLGLLALPAPTAAIAAA